RNLERLRRARAAVAVGKLSGAVGTFAHGEPEVEAEGGRELGLEAALVSTQIIQRDRHAEFCAMLAVAAASLETIALEVRGLQRTEILEAQEPFGEGQKGSSAMPHKRNPELAERICGLARLLRTNALAALENVALWHERDISHSSVERVVLPDSTILLDYLLSLATFIVEGLEVDPARMAENLYEGKAKIVYATDHPGLIVQYFKDDATAFNALKRGTIVGKGVVNNRMSAAMFARLERAKVPTHYLGTLSDREMLCRRLDI